MNTAPISLARPPCLKPGDRIAVVSSSWGGPGTFPHRYEAGKHQFEAEFGVQLVPMPHALADADFVKTNPAARADDLMAAFSDPAIAGIVASIGGDDAVRLIPHLDLAIIAANPKVFLGFSDTTAIHFACLAAGLGSFYGPSLMAGFAENGGMHRYTVEGVRKALFSASPMGRVAQNLEGWTVERLDWSDPALQGRSRRLLPAEPPRCLQGNGKARGHLVGGCAEVLEMLKGTAWWPGPAIWDGAIFFYETSENAPSPDLVRYWFRNYAATGMLRRLAGIIVARPDPGTDLNYARELERAIIDILGEEGLAELPVLSGLDFGHTQPMWTLPYGAAAEIDCSAATLTVLTAAVK